jgi:hypothetical protein
LFFLASLLPCFYRFLFLMDKPLEPLCKYSLNQP